MALRRSLLSSTLTREDQIVEVLLILTSKIIKTIYIFLLKYIAKQTTEGD
jgi:hypothetical protein